MLRLKSWVGGVARAICVGAFATLVLSGVVTDAAGQVALPPAFAEASTAEGWAWSQIKLGKPADFNTHCARRADPRKYDDPEWSDADNCRTLTADFLIRVLTGSAFRRELPYTGLTVIGAKITGDLNLNYATISAPLAIMESRVEGGVFLKYANAQSLVNLSGTFIANSLDFSDFRSKSDLELAHVIVENSPSTKSAVKMDDALLEGFVDLAGATIDGDFEADGLEARDLDMESDALYRANFKSVVLNSAKISKQVVMIGTTIEGDLNADGLQAQDVLMVTNDERAANPKREASFKNLNLEFAAIYGEIVIDGANVTGTLKAHGLQTGDLYIRSGNSAKITFKELDLDSTKTARVLYISGAIFGTIDLRRASVGEELQIGAKNETLEWLPVADDKVNLDLRNAHVGSLSDDEASWPPPGRLLLDGFTFGRLGGRGEATSREMIARGADWWDENWAKLDRSFSPWPYEELAAVFAAAGARDAADDIRYREQARADEHATTASWLPSNALRWVAGYGIGTYMFRALDWALALALMAAFYLRYCVKSIIETNRSFIWCFGASVNQLLPVLSLKKEFSDFFADKNLNGFTPRQDFLFTMLSVVGWLLGAIVLAAIGTITHSR